MDEISKEIRSVRSQTPTLIDGCVKIVSAYVGNNSIVAGSVVRLIVQVHEVLEALESSPKPAKRRNFPPAVEIERSVTDDYIICLEDGKCFKTLKRHLRIVYGLTPEQYRGKWGLPPSYPMVAPNYAIKRSNLAKKNRLGEGARQSIRRRSINAVSAESNDHDM